MGKKWYKAQQKTEEAVEYVPNPEINRVFEPKPAEPLVVGSLPFTEEAVLPFTEALRGYPASVRMPDGSIELNPKR
jgi:hypothetical protein